MTKQFKCNQCGQTKKIEQFARMYESYEPKLNKYTMKPVCKTCHEEHMKQKEGVKRANA